jgi:hypothetical protein
MSDVYANGALSTAIRVLISKFAQNGKDFLSLSKDWQHFLSAIVVRKRGVSKKGITIFAKEFAEIITPEKEARISEIFSYINESIQVCRMDSSISIHSFKSEKMQYILTDYILDMDIDNKGNRTSETHALPSSFIYRLVDTI